MQLAGLGPPQEHGLQNSLQELVAIDGVGRDLVLDELFEGLELAVWAWMRKGGMARRRLIQSRQLVVRLTEQVASLAELSQTCSAET